MKHHIFSAIAIDRRTPCKLVMFLSLQFPFSALWHLRLSKSHFVLILPPCPSSSLPLSHTFQCLPGDAYHWRAQHLFLHPIDPVIETSLICSLLPVLYLPPISRSLSFLRLLCQERATSTAWQLPIILHYSLSRLFNPNERCCYKFSWIWRAFETNWSMYSLSGMLGRTCT